MMIKQGMQEVSSLFSPINWGEIQTLRKKFFVLISFIVLLGLIMVYSSSYIYAKEHFNSSTYYVLRQLTYLFFSISFAFVVSKSKCFFWIKYGKYINILAAFVLVLTFVPGLGAEAKGAYRWIAFGGLSFQPAEIVKITLILSSLSYFEDFSFLSLKQKVYWGLSLFFPLVLILIQPDFGSFFVALTLLIMTCYLSSFPRKLFYAFVSLGVLATIPALLLQSYRVKRLLIFLDPWSDPQGSGFQIIQSYLAFAGGGLWGQGLGNSNEKLFYLPEAHNDFIFSVLGEELGFIGVIFLVLLFLASLTFSFLMALKIENKKRSLLITALTFNFGFQVILNMSVVLGLIPTKGLNLPLISYGGSSLLANFFLIGLIFSCTNSNKAFDNTKSRDDNSILSHNKVSTATPSLNSSRLPK